MAGSILSLAFLWQKKHLHFRCIQYWYVGAKQVVGGNMRIEEGRVAGAPPLRWRYAGASVTWREDGEVGFFFFLGDACLRCRLKVDYALLCFAACKRDIL